MFTGFYNAGLLSPSGSLPIGRWHHIAWIRGGGGAANTGSTLFIDGIDVTASLLSDPALCCNASAPVIDATEFRVNRGRDQVSFFVAAIDELALYDRALTAQEVADHVAASGIGTAVDVDGDGVESALTDGLLILRYLFGFRGATLTTGAVSQTCTRCTAVAIEAYIASLLRGAPVGAVLLTGSPSRRA